MQRLQRAAGNRAVSRLVAQRYTAPVKPSPAQAPGFRKVKADVAAKKVRLAAHTPAATESKSAQDAAVAPPDDKEAQGKAANAEKMNAAKPGEFNKQAFIDAVNKAIDAQAPKNLDQADKFSKSGKADQIKDEVDGKVKDGKDSSAKDIDTATKAPPDTAAAKDKPVTPLTPDQPPANPGAPSATDAVPDKQPAAVTDFSEGPAANDQAMADAEVTEDQLAKGNEPEFDQALSTKKTAEADSAKAPAKGRAAEAQQLSTAKAGAAASGAQALNALTATRASAGKQVDGGKGETKSKDEKKRAEVTAKLQKVYDGTKKDVEETLSGLDKKVDDKFTSGEKAARDAFTADHKRRMKKYKDKRYSGMFGGAKWAKDKLMGMPKEANNLFQEARKLYVAQMQTVISSVADIIGTELGKAKARIAKGRTELKAEVDKLPADLREFGQEAATDFAGKFDDLEATVNEKSEQLVQDLANKYTAALNKIDEEIKKLQEANKGLVQKAKDAIVGALKTINELKNLLLGILAKAASAIMKIIKDPIGFLGNLVKAVGAGLNLFITNIAEHLKTGVVSWLLGTAVKAGLELPQKFDLKGIIQLIASLLGLTWDNIRARITRKGIPDEAMTAVETSVPVAKKLATEGPAGAINEITEEAGDLKATILEKLTSYLIPTVIIAGITWIISLLNPASAFVRAVKGIIDIVTFIVNQGAQIVEFVNAVLDAVIAIANGGSAGVPKMVEAALATSVPLLIGFLASLLGIGSLANKVKSVFHAVARPVNRAIDKIVNFIAKKGKALWNKLKGKKRDPHDPKAGKSQKELAQLARKAAEEATRRVAGGVSPTQAKSILREIESRYKRQGLTSLSFITGTHGKTSVRIRAKVNPEYSANDVDTVSQPGDKFAELPWIHEIRGWATLNHEAAKMEINPAGGADKKKEWAPPTFARGIISWSGKSAAQSRNTKTFESSNMEASDKKFMRSYSEAHGEEKVIQAFDRLLWGDYGESSLEGVVINMDLFINRSSCVNCADFIAEFVRKLEKRGAAVTAKANVTAPYRGGSVISEEVRKRNGDLIKQFASKSLTTHEQLEKAHAEAQKKNPSKPPPEPKVGRFWGTSEEETRKRIEEVKKEYQKAQKDIAEQTEGSSGVANPPPVPDELRWHQLRGTNDTQKLGVAILEKAGVQVHAITLDSIRSTNFSDQEISIFDSSADPSAAEIAELAARRPDYQSLDTSGGIDKTEQQMAHLRKRLKDRTKQVNELVADERIQEIRKQAQERKEAEKKAAEDLTSGG
ncbi:phage tail protein [Streptomyces sp. NPDC001948]